MSVDNINKAKKNLDKIKESKNKTFVIHYSCESFTTNSSSRITSISLKKIDTSTKHFSIYQESELKKYSIDLIENKYDKLEKEMLDKYFEYINNQEDYLFVHWNMRDSIFGFESIENRYRILGGTPTKIAESNKIDLSALLINLYGDNYIPHDRLHSLIRKNKLTDKDFLSGKDEALAFTQKEYKQLELSALRKIISISDILSKTLDNSLKTDMKFKYQISRLLSDYPFIYKLIKLVLSSLNIFAVFLL